MYAHYHMSLTCTLRLNKSHNNNKKHISCLFITMELVFLSPFYYTLTLSESET